MNVLSSEEVHRLREAFERGRGVRAAARELRINRETCAKYFRAWQGALPQEPIERAKHYRLIADVEEWLTTLKPERSAVLRAAFYAGLANPTGSPSR